jgi:tetratricopeptide (TPR) repeat protein
VLVEQLWANLILFAAGQAAAWFYLHTGRTGLGAAATAALWVLADWYLVAKFVYRVEGPGLWLPLAGLQLVAWVTICALSVAQWRRRRSATARQRVQLFADGMAAYLRGRCDEAQAIFRRLARNDPWDAAAWVAWGNVLLRMGRIQPARRCYRRALGVDSARHYAELVRHQLLLAAEAARGGPRPVRSAPAPAVEAAPTV